MTDWRKRLQQLDHPIYVSIIGAGAMGKGLAWQGYVQTRRTLAMWTVRNVVAVTGGVSGRQPRRVRGGWRL